MIKVLYITYDGLTDHLGQSQILPYLARLSKSGYLFHIISFEKKNNYFIHREEIQKVLDENNIIWHPLSYTKKPPVISTLYDIFRMEKSAFTIHKSENFRIVHCRSYLPSLVGLKMKIKTGVKFVFDMRGFWADERVEGGLWNLKNPIYKIIFFYFKRMERKFLTWADYTVSLTQSAKNIIQYWKYIPNQPVPVEVIPCCVDTELFSREKIDAQKISRLKSQLNIGEGDFVISYLGALGTWYLLDEMLLFFKCLLRVKSNAKFLFITFENPDVIMKKAVTLNIPATKILIKKVKRQEVPLYLSLSNLSVIFIKNCFSKKASSPTKMGEILALGIPVVCNSGIGDVEYLINKTKGGILIKDLNEPEYRKAVNQIDTVTGRINEHAIEAVKEFLSIDKGVESYKNIYQNISSG